MKFKILGGAILVAGPLIASAGINGLTSHSRANCLTINESITWDLTRHWTARIYDEHAQHQYDGAKGPVVASHHDDSKIVTSWRIAIVHLNESHDHKWGVYAQHSLYRDGVWSTLAHTGVTDCSIYDGWWHPDHPERDS